MTETIEHPLHAPTAAPPAEASTDAPPTADETTGTAPIPVDNPKLPDPGVTTEKRRPIIAPWLRSRRDLIATVERAAGHAWYATAYHGLRAPWYGMQLALMAPRGTARLVASTNRWVWDREAAPLRDFAVRQEDVEEYMRLARLRAGRVRLRGFVTVIACTCSASASPCGCTSWPPSTCTSSPPAESSPSATSASSPTPRSSAPPSCAPNSRSSPARSCSAPSTPSATRRSPPP
jgi:hypothetical protein